LNVVKKENEWGYSPKGAVAFTQEEEGKAAVFFISRTVREAVSQNFPLRAQYQLAKYKPIFQGGLLGAYNKAQSLVKPVGEKSCKSLVKSNVASKPYYAQFVSRYCGLFGSRPREIAGASQEKVKELYRGINLVLNVEDFPSELFGDFNSQAQTNFSKTPWFDANAANVIELKLSGKYTKTIERIPQSRVFEYTVSVPYTEYVPVKKTRQIPFLDLERTCSKDSAGLETCQSVPMAKLKNDEYTVQEPVTRFRIEPRTQRYEGMEINQALGLYLSGQMILGKNNVNIQVSERDEKRDFQHDWNMPAIGLLPKRAELPAPFDWIKLRANQIGQKIESSATQAWRDTYCNSMGNATSMEEQGDIVHRCLRGKPAETPRFVASWYDNNFGVTVEQVEQTLGLSDY
ncbi:MAG: hypothetical protein EB078_06745, partial [Proteobacteria bacterium]|nr:hypothetical protein [Pseudomonadota bacterium]